MSLPTHPILRAVAWLSVVFLASGCSSADSRAQSALADYQEAASSNDMAGARRALLRLVQAKDDVPDYWTQLGSLDAAMGAYGDAYYAFTRAYELNRSDPGILRILTQLALRSGDLSTAQARAKELEIVAPGDPWIKLAKGWADIGESRFDQAAATADELLAQNRYDPTASLLKARALFGLNREDEAITFLTQHLQAIPNDRGALELLAQFEGRRDEWDKVADARLRLSRLRPDDRDNMLALADASFRAGRIGQAREASFRLLKPNAPLPIVSKVLNLWSNWPSAQRLDDVRKLAATAPPQQRAVYAAFLSGLGSPGDAVRIISKDAALPVRAESAEANAVLGDALLRGGNLPAAKNRLDAVIAFDPGNATALRARAELELRTGKAADAVEDAQKLITVLPKSDGDRLLLARAYDAAGKKSWAERTLWTAFNDIPASGTIYGALRATKAGNPDALADLQAEFERQRDGQVRKGIL